MANKFYIKIDNQDERIYPKNGGLLPRLFSITYGTNTTRPYYDDNILCGRWYDLDNLISKDNRDDTFWSNRLESIACYDAVRARAISFNNIMLKVYKNGTDESNNVANLCLLDTSTTSISSDDKNDNGYWINLLGTVGVEASNNNLRTDANENNTYYYDIIYTNYHSNKLSTTLNPFELDYTAIKTDNYDFTFHNSTTDSFWQKEKNNQVNRYLLNPDSSYKFTNIGKLAWSYNFNGKTTTVQPNDSITINTVINGKATLTPAKTQPTQPTQPPKTQPTEPPKTQPTQPTQPPKTQTKSLTLPSLPAGVDSITAGNKTLTAVKYGQELNCFLNLNSRYRFKDRNNLGQGLIYTDANGNTVKIGSLWDVVTDNDGNDECHIQIDLSKIYDDTVINNLRYDLNIEKYKHDDDKGGLIPITTVLKHCTINPQKAKENDETEITITADDGYILDSDIVYYSYNKIYTGYTKLTKKVSKQTSITINIWASSLYDYENTENRNYSDEPVIIATATLKGSLPTGQANGKLYNISDGQLQSVMNTVIEEWENSGTDSNEEAYDFTQFVNQVYKIPFNVPANIQKHVTNILAGNTTVKADANEITNSIFNVSCGTIKVPLHYNNAHDYEPTKVILVLPYLKEISLNGNDVINKTIAINYQLDLNSGIITVLVSNEYGTIYSQQQNIKTDLSTYAINYNRIVSRPSSIFLNNVNQAYILISYRKPLLNLKTYTTNETGKLKDFRGLTVAKNAKIDFNIDSWEQNQLNSILSQGVFINDVTSD